VNTGNADLAEKSLQIGKAAEGVFSEPLVLAEVLKVEA